MHMYMHAHAAKNISKCLLRRGTVCHQKVPVISRTLTVLMVFKKGLLEKYLLVAPLTCKCIFLYLYAHFLAYMVW